MTHPTIEESTRQAQAAINFINGMRRGRGQWDLPFHRLQTLMGHGLVPLPALSAEDHLEVALMHLDAAGDLVPAEVHPWIVAAIGPAARASGYLSGARPGTPGPPSPPASR